MGFAHADAIKALRVNGNDLHRALDHLNESAFESASEVSVLRALLLVSTGAPKPWIQTPLLRLAPLAA